MRSLAAGVIVMVMGGATTGGFNGRIRVRRVAT
jgi:hypothetical protein